MKDYNEEYFYIKPAEMGVYPILNYIRGGSNPMEVFLDTPLDTTKVRVVCLAPPIPRAPQFADHHYLAENSTVISE